MKVIGVIPARYGSTRFPGKPLADIGGTSMIMRVVSQANKCRLFSQVVVATDDARIYDHVTGFGAQAVMTSMGHPSGTDRCLEAVELTDPSAELVVNIQGDEPFVDPTQLETLIMAMHEQGSEIGTLAIRISSAEVLSDFNKVKVVMDAHGRALYFSRFPIPFRKEVPQKQWLIHGDYFKHLGLYAYRTAILRRICELPPSSLERSESLEQLRWLQAGYSIQVALTDIETPAVDTPEDLEKIIKRGDFAQ
ncbi:MAG: 3-deoxy-manno-octulosonate cytidylyltransferase [Flavobacteriales bacterium]